MALSLMCLNIEGTKHLDRIIPFLKEHQPDVFCVQELLEDTIPQLEAVAGPLCSYAPTMRHPAYDFAVEGIVMFS